MPRCGNRRTLGGVDFVLIAAKTELQAVANEVTACAAGSKSAGETEPLGQIRANGLSQFLQGNMNTRLHLGILAC